MRPRRRGGLDGPRTKGARVNDALIDVCFERGFAEVTIEALCERAGIDRAAFERQFADLDACSLCVIEREVKSFLQPLASACLGLIDWRDRLPANAQ